MWLSFKTFAGPAGLEVSERSISERKNGHRIFHGKEAPVALPGQSGLGPQLCGADAAGAGKQYAPRHQVSKNPIRNQKAFKRFQKELKTKHFPQELCYAYSNQFSPRLTILILDATVWPSRDMDATNQSFWWSQQGRYGFGGPNSKLLVGWISSLRSSQHWRRDKSGAERLHWQQRVNGIRDIATVPLVNFEADSDQASQAVGGQTAGQPRHIWSQPFIRWYRSRGW